MSEILQRLWFIKMKYDVRIIKFEESNTVIIRFYDKYSIQM